MPSVDYLKECRDFYARVLQPCFGAPLGASETVVSELQQKLGFTLPESYRQFLLWRCFQQLYQHSSDNCILLYWAASTAIRLLRPTSHNKPNHGLTRESSRFP